MASRGPFGRVCDQIMVDNPAFLGCTLDDLNWGECSVRDLLQCAEEGGGEAPPPDCEHRCDCDDGGICSAVGACVAAEAGCNANADCPCETICRRGLCRAGCFADLDCREGRICRLVDDQTEARCAQFLPE